MVRRPLTHGLEMVPLFKRNEVELEAEGAQILHPGRPAWTGLEAKGEVKVEQ